MGKLLRMVLASGRARIDCGALVDAGVWAVDAVTHSVSDRCGWRVDSPGNVGDRVRLRNSGARASGR